MEAVTAPSMADAAVAQPAAAIVTASEPRPLTLTPALMAQLNAVDRAINGAIIQTADLRTYGQDDYWATPLEDGPITNGRARGDCEDYALEKRRALIAQGVPVEDLSIAVADTRWGPHAVLLVDTDRGEYVLDSLTGKVMPWTKVGYRWVKRQAWGDPMRWEAIASAN
jgi:predicted transglutaminase-like cysteine proteinase